MQGKPLGSITFLNRTLPFYSKIEGDYLSYQAQSRGVLDIIAKPVTITANELEDYTPDYFIQMDKAQSKSFIVQIISESEFQSAYNQQKWQWRAANQFCKENGFDFRLIDERRVYHQGFYNLQFLADFATKAVSKQVQKALLADIKTRGVVNAHYLLERYFKGKVNHLKGWSAIYYLMANNLVGFDVSADITSLELELWHDKK